MGTLNLVEEYGRNVTVEQGWARCLWVRQGKALLCVSRGPGMGFARKRELAERLLGYYLWQF